jgi:hypothetical protein
MGMFRSLNEENSGGQLDTQGAEGGQTRVTSRSQLAVMSLRGTEIRAGALDIPRAGSIDEQSLTQQQVGHESHIRQHRVTVD